MKTVVGVFKSLAEAEGAANSLENLGIPRKDISVVAGDDASRYKEYHEKASHKFNVEASAEAGASIGAGVGLIASVVALAIPGVGPIIAGGALATLLASVGAGAASGGLIAALVEWGIPQEEAPIYDEAVRRGAVMVGAYVDENLEQDALGVLERSGGHDLHEEPGRGQPASWPAGREPLAEEFNMPRTPDGPPPPRYSPD